MAVAGGASTARPFTAPQGRASYCIGMDLPESPWDTINQKWWRTGLKLFLLSQDHTLLEIALSQHRSVSCCSNSAMNESLSFESYTFVSSLWWLGLLLCRGLSLQKNRAWKMGSYETTFLKSVSLYMYILTYIYKIYVFIKIGVTTVRLNKLF